MKFNGALVKVSDEQVIGVAVVEEDFLEQPMETRIARMKQYKEGFGPQVPIVLLLEAASGNSEETYWGRPDLIESLKEVPLNMMTFKTYEAPDAN